MDALFSYGKSYSLIHKIPAWIKLLILLTVPVSVYVSPIWVCAVLMGVFALIVPFAGMSFSMFLRDIKPVLFYAMILLAADILSFLLFSSENLITRTSVFMLLRLACAMEATSVFFRTTSVFEIGETLRNIEHAVSFGHTNYGFSNVFTLFLSFLSQIFFTWAEINAAYRARGGKNGFSKPLRLLPILITLSIKKANTTYLALLNRS